MTSRRTASRLLSVLELLQAKGRLSGSELARRLGVDGRTVRRYVASLEEMGIPVTAERGAAGGYELVAGYKLPPLVFTNDEALALGLGLAVVRGWDLVEAGAAHRAQSKLERVLPATVREQLLSAVECAAFGRLAGPSRGYGESFAVLARSTFRSQGVSLRYRSAAGEVSERDLDPYGLAFSRGLWYVVGHCHLRKGLRTFRLDRVEGASSQPRSFARPAGFDALAHLVHSIAALPRRHSVEVLLHTDLEGASRVLFPELGLLEPRPPHVLLRAQTDDLPWFARELAHLKWPFEILAPSGLARAVERHARTLLRTVDRSLRSAR